MKNNELLPIEAIMWMKEHGYADADHETRMALICEAKKLFGVE